METNKGDKHFPQVSDPYPKFSLVDTSPIVSRSHVLPGSIFVSLLLETVGL